MMKSFFGAVTLVLVSASVFVCTFLAFAALRGFVVMKLWAWFLVPVFGLQAIGLWTAYGMALLAATLHPQTVDTKDGISVGLVQPLTALLFGYLIHLFI